MQDKASKSYLSSDYFVPTETINFVRPLDYEDIHFIKNGKDYSTMSLIAEHEILELLKKYLIKDTNGYHIKINKMNETELKIIKIWFEGK
jgi:hypothetical protein